MSRLALKTLEILAVTTIYIVTARIGQYFAIDPGNITPVWIPSGIMLAWALIRGNYIWPGIFLGAFLGNIWAYADLQSVTATLPALVSATCNGLGDCIAVVGAVLLIRRTESRNNPFISFQTFRALVLYGVIAGPLASAVFGVSSLYLANLVSPAAYGSSLLTWWIGDATGVLLFTPFILSFRFPEARSTQASHHEIAIYLFCVGCLPFLAWMVVDDIFLTHTISYLYIPVLFWATLRLDLRYAFGATIYLIGAAVVTTSLGKGFFRHDILHISILSLQTFTFIVVASIFSAALLMREKIFALVKLQTDYYLDTLTGLYTRHFFNIQLTRARDNAVRSRAPLCIIMYDIDHFKSVNDSFGHFTGDEVLKRLSKLVKQQVRSHDTLARWGGEEFIILLPETTLEEATQLAERIRASVEKARLLKERTLTISLGVIECNPSRHISQELDRLDRALYLAKRSGRNRVETDNEERTEPEVRESHILYSL